MTCKATYISVCICNLFINNSFFTIEIKTLFYFVLRWWQSIDHIYTQHCLSIKKKMFKLVKPNFSKPYRYISLYIETNIYLWANILLKERKRRRKTQKQEAHRVLVQIKLRKR